MSAQVIKAKAASERAGLGLRTMYREISEGRFPRPIQLTPKRSGWLVSEIDAWIQAKVERRDGVAG